MEDVELDIIELYSEADTLFHYISQMLVLWDSCATLENYDRRK